MAYRFPAAARVLKARPRVLVEEGRTKDRVLRRELMTEEEVLTQLRLHGITDLREVHQVLIEPNAMVSVLRRDGGEPAEPAKAPVAG